MTDPRELATHLDAVADLHDGQDGSPITRDLLRDAANALRAAVDPWQPPDPNSDMAVPLHELHADAAYLAHRVHQGSMSPDELAAVIRAKIDAFMAPPIFTPEGQP